MPMMQKKRRVKVLDSYMSYIDTRAGEDIVIFLHGNITSSYVWRNVIPHVQGYARCIAPDLLGFGDSGKESSHQYRFEDQYRYFCAWLESIKLDGDYIFVCQELGSMIAFHWCSKHPEKVKGLVYMEPVVAPFSSFDDLIPKSTRELYEKVRHDKATEEKVLKENYFLETILSDIAINRKLTEADLKNYRLPFSKQGESRRAMITAVKELPFENDGPNDVVNIVKNYQSWLSTSEEIPKLYINAEPGLFSAFVSDTTKDWPNQIKVTVPGKHLVQEESHEALSRALLDYIKEHQIINYG